jgi:hypothetical protein
MNIIYFVVVVLTLYSDLLIKGNLSGSMALAVQYILAFVILALMVKIGDKKKTDFTSDSSAANIISFFVYFLIFNYTIQMLTANDVPMMHSATHLAYVCIPLLFLPVVLWRCPEFNLAKLCGVFLLLMIPVNVVGFIQYFIDSSFLISYSYSESGGIVLRNSYHGVFSRYPSIFVSADRYSAIALIQLYFSIILLSLTEKRTFKFSLWINFNLICGALGILISGARSRIFIVLILMFFMTLSLFAFNWLRLKSRNKFNAVLASMLILIGSSIFIISNPSTLESELVDFPVIDLLTTSIKKKATEERILRYISRTSVSYDVTLLGKGLGSLGYGGKPAEIGVGSIWIECGVVGGILILTGFFGIIIVLLYLTITAFIRGSPLDVCIFGLPTLALSMGLLTGLTSVFEFSSGILLMVAVGANIQRYSYGKLSFQQGYKEELSST